jgi:hypothetical protein
MHPTSVSTYSVSVLRVWLAAKPCSNETFFGFHCANHRLLPVPLLLLSSSPISSFSLPYLQLASSYHLDLWRNSRILVMFNCLGVFHSDQTVQVGISQIVFHDLQVVRN